MVKKKQIKRKKETDTTYILKLVLYVIVGSQWLRLTNPDMTHQIPIPIGFIVGIMFASHEHFQIDRKLEYLVLIIAMVTSFWSQSGLVLTVLK